MKNGTVISLIRHGHVHNPDGLFYGRLPGFGLSAQGRSEAKRVGHALGGKPLTAIFCGPLLRARQTAQEIGLCHHALKIRVSSLLNEVNSAFEGCPMTTVRSQAGEVYASAGRQYDQPRDVFQRSRKFIAKILTTYPGQHVAAITHGDVIVFTLLGFRELPLTPEAKTMLARLGLPFTYPETGSVTTLSFLTGSTEESPRVHYFKPEKQSQE